MRLALALLLALHGAVHLLGFVKGFGLAEVAQLRLPIDRLAGALWLVAALAFLATAGLLLAGWRRWWLVGLPAVALSQALIVHAWADARFGTLPNLIALVPLLLAALDAGPGSFRSLYARACAEHRALVPASAPPVTEADLAPLPPPVQRWLRRVGVVGRPRVLGFRARFRGRFRRAPGARWMPMTAEQLNVVAPSARIFLMEASLAGVPMAGLHVFTGASARMQVRVAGLIDVVDATGPMMDRSETVTVLNDLCVLAPSALLDASVRFAAIDDRSARVEYTRGAHTVAAVLHFDEAGDLVDFVSGDRFMSADGRTGEPVPWSTPMTGHQEREGVRVPGRGDVTWRLPGGDFVYGEFHLVDLEVLPACSGTRAAGRRLDPRRLAAPGRPRGHGQRFPAPGARP